MTLQTPDEAKSRTPEQARAPIWKEGYRLIRSNPRTMLPVLATQIPLSIAAAVAWIILYAVAFPDVDVDAGTLFGSEAPRQLILWVAIISWAHSLFTSVGIAGAIVAVRATLDGRPQPLSASLDPPFTRLGGLLVIFVIFQALLLAGGVLFITGIGLVLTVYLALRLGLGLHAFILEEVNIPTAIRRSWRLTRGNAFRLLGTVVVVLAVFLVSLVATTIVLVLVLIPFYSEDPSRNVSLMTNAGVFLALGAALVPAGTYFAATTTIFYRRIGETRDDRSPA